MGTKEPAEPNLDKLERLVAKVPKSDRVLVP